MREKQDNCEKTTKALEKKKQDERKRDMGESEAK